MQSFEQRREYSEKRIATFAEKIKECEALQKQTGLSVYIAGSYGRGEASEYSDLDLFFIHDKSYQAEPVSDYDLTLIRADFHRAAQDMGLPRFSRDMEFLVPHNLQEILRVLGSPADDFYNHFTTRMLLLLESQCAFNEIVYENAKTQIILAYYRDYHDHRHNFIPLFLVNDIHRYWRTLCLNYEHTRNDGKNASAKPEEKNKYHVANLKLKFSRMLTCFSAIIPLSKRGLVADHDFVRNLTKKKSLQRLKDFAVDVPAAMEPFKKIEEEYMWFLEATAKPKEKLREWIGQKENRVVAFGHAKNFRDGMFDLLKVAVNDTDLLSLLVL